jgi:hypothetical protein
LSFNNLANKLKVRNRQREFFHISIVENQLVLNPFQSQVFGDFRIVTSSNKIFHEVGKRPIKEMKSVVGIAKEADIDKEFSQSLWHFKSGGIVQSILPNTVVLQQIQSRSG